MDVPHLVLNAVTVIFIVIFIVATMFAVGLRATVPALCGVFADVPPAVADADRQHGGHPAAGLGHRRAVRPLLGFLHRPRSDRLLPGGPFGAKLATVQQGDIVAGAAMQVLLASLGSLTFAPTVNAILTAADIGTKVSLDVGALVRTVALLQLVPFAIGLLLRRYAEPTAQAWHPTAAAVSNIAFLVVLAGMLLGNWRDVVDLFGSLALLAGFLLAVFAFAAGTLLATGPTTRRTTMGGVASVRNAGPALAAIGLAFADQPAILGALAAILLSGLAAALPIATLLSRHRGAPGAATSSPSSP
ncbi:hypothetical protein [Streptomyces puniciscabiei]|uniref:hypothetical protein n=1 Tax=Streptomyces puniciscabiei TaxID=164348 RepID=UPI0033184537